MKNTQDNILAGLTDEQVDEMLMRDTGMTLHQIDMKMKKQKEKRQREWNKMTEGESYGNKLLLWMR